MGILDSYWKSNPYLTQGFTGESDAMHPQWVFLDLASVQPVSAIRIAWAEPFAVQYEVQYWTGEDPIQEADTRSVADISRRSGARR